MHMFDFSIAASWIVYWRHQHVLQKLKKDILDYLQFREKFAEYLLHADSLSDNSSREMSDHYLHEPVIKLRKEVTQHPPNTLRKNQTLHLPQFSHPVTTNHC